MAGWDIRLTVVGRPRADRTERPLPCAYAKLQWNLAEQTIPDTMVSQALARNCRKSPPYRVRSIVWHVAEQAVPYDLRMYSVFGSWFDSKVGTQYAVIVYTTIKRIGFLV